MENQQIPQATNQLDNLFNITFDPETRADIRQAAVWAKVSAICAFIGYVAVLAVAMFARPDAALSDNGEQINRMVHTSSMIGVVVSIGIGILINYFLYRFATATVNGMDAMDSTKTNEGFNNLRVYFKVLGILVIIAISFIVLIFIFGAISAALLSPRA